MNLAPSVFYGDRQTHLNIWWQGALLLSVFFALSVVLSAFDQRLLADEALGLSLPSLQYPLLSIL